MVAAKRVPPRLPPPPPDEVQLTLTQDEARKLRNYFGKLPTDVIERELGAKGGLAGLGFGLYNELRDLDLDVD